MTPEQLSAVLDSRVYGERHSSGEADGITWDVRASPRAGLWRVTVAVPWAQCPPRISDHYRSESSAYGCAVLGVFLESPDPTAALAKVARWRIVQAR